MFESKNKIYLVYISYLKEDKNNYGDDVFKIFPCSDKQTAERFEKHFRKKYPDTQLMQIEIIESPIFSDTFEGVINHE